MTDRVAVIDHSALVELVGLLHAEGYVVVGPTLRENAIVLAELDDGDDLVSGWGVDTEAGRYRVVRRADDAVFAHSAGPQSWKSFLHPARRRLLSTDTSDGDLTVEPEPEPSRRMAFLGVRPCDLVAIGVLDRVLAGGRYPDPGYTARRDGVLVIVANCTEPGATCFCVSMGGGPRAPAGFDLALTERVDDAGHRFLVEVGSAAGEELLAALPHRAATDADLRVADDDLADAAEHMGRAMPEVDLRALLVDSRESPHWAEVASRCLACGNCTMVCPTCFCTTTEEVTDLTGEHGERWQRWSSCFDLDFSYLHGGEVRTSRQSRYRQWMTHKLSTWYDQFGSSGCVGCGRCIVWCPVGIDITEEAASLTALASREVGT
ncbi:4Fe-4S dicluster domain-containing protein [Streptoalloteichus hindustanus]|uniref:4Fe-4S dicluster containing protein n=1 Tax=Streptoalloteichus hindustanus TaxID=2017 RepID=A0A1M5DSY2_STRHI|nr:4Fe-4S dicluster domain-containing protein [Streptoalloteichus hindustanus]SHF70148.1 4Fe-4S dicluster containing protein [Streptoalloteichus hindustanus]